MNRILKTHAKVAGFVGLFLAFGALTVAAQPGQRMQDPEERLERMMSHLSPTLQLSEEQAAKVREILSEQIQKQQDAFEARRSAERQDRQAMRTEMEKWRAETDARMTEVLTEDQVEQYKKYMEQNRRGPRGERGMRRGARGKRG